MLIYSFGAFLLETEQNPHRKTSLTGSLSYLLRRFVGKSLIRKLCCERGEETQGKVFTVSSKASDNLHPEKKTSAGLLFLPLPDVQAPNCSGVVAILFTTGLVRNTRHLGGGYIYVNQTLVVNQPHKPNTDQRKSVSNNWQINGNNGIRTTKYTRMSGIRILRHDYRLGGDLLNEN